MIDKPKANSTANQGLAFGEFCAVLKCVGDENYQNCAEAFFYPGEKWGEMLIQDYSASKRKIVFEAMIRGIYNRVTSRN